MNRFSHVVDELKFLGRRPQKLLYEHVPKCGGTSITNLLSRRYRARTTFQINGANPQASIAEFRSLPEERRHAYDLVMGHGAHQLREDFVPDAVRFTVLRDPVDRIISHYYFVMRNPRHYLHERVTGQQLSLRDYATSGISGELRNCYVSRFLGEAAEDFEKTPESSVDRAFRVLRDEYAVVGLLEDMPGALANLTRETGLKCNAALGTMKVGTNRPKLDTIDEHTIRAIEDVNALDICLYQRVRQALGSR